MISEYHSATRTTDASAPEPDEQDRSGVSRRRASKETKLPIKSVDEVIEEAGEDTPWIQENLLARGSLTVLAGKAKEAGKTTFCCHGIAAGARGEEHAGFLTTPARYLYCTEQGNNFADYLKNSALDEYPDHIRVVQFKDVFNVGWQRLTESAAIDAKELGMDALVIDPFAPFAGLGEGGENDSGVIGEKLRFLRGLAQRYDLGVLLIHHLGKDGTLRGSSAFEAEADIIVSLTRPEGRHGPSVRRIDIKGRYGLLGQNTELRDGRFVSLGDDNRVEFNKAVDFIKATLPDSPDPGIRKNELIELRKDADDISVRTLERALGWLVMKKTVGERQLRERGAPKVYWNAENRYPDPGARQSDTISRQTPTPTQGGLARNNLSRQTYFAKSGGEGKNGRENGVDKRNTIIPRQTLSI